MLETIQVNTPDHTVMVDVTDLVARKVQESGIRNGLCVIYVPHTTAGLTINEGADPAVSEDILNALNRMVPIEGSVPAHGRQFRRPHQGRAHGNQRPGDHRER